MASNFAGDQIICNFANELSNYLRNGTGQQQGSTSYQLRRSETEPVVLEPSGRRHLRGRNEQPAGNRQAQEQSRRGEDSSAISGRGAGENQGCGQEVDSLQGATVGRRPVDELRRKAAKIRAEIARRNQKREDFRKKYNCI